MLYAFAVEFVKSTRKVREMDRATAISAHLCGHRTKVL